MRGRQQFPPIGLQLGLCVAPGEVGVGLGEAHLGKRPHHVRPGERLGQEQHVRFGRLHFGYEPLPELDRLGVGIVDPEYPHAVRGPVPDHTKHLVVKPDRIVVEVERVDVLVFFRRILRIGDGAVALHGEPFRVLLRPRVVRCALQGEVESDLHTQCPGLGDELVEVLDRAQRRVDGIVATALAADRPGRAGIVGTRDEGVVRALAVDLPDGMDRWQVDHVEAHRGDGGQPPRRGREGS